MLKAFVKTGKKEIKVGDTGSLSVPKKVPVVKDDWLLEVKKWRIKKWSISIKVEIRYRAKSMNSNIGENRLKKTFQKAVEHPILKAFKNRLGSFQ